MSASVGLLRPHHYAKPGPKLTANDPSWGGRALCSRYSWPSNLKGGGRIGIIELGGGYMASDTAAYAAANHFPVPVVAHETMNNVRPGDIRDDASGEVALDVQLAALAYSVATGLPADITIFWTDDIATGVQAAADLGMDVFSISWGMDEMGWGAPELLRLETICQAAVARGMIITAASGDNDSSDGGNNAANVDSPASCPSVIGCGGTSLPHGSAPETVWNNNPGNPQGDGTGGGFSTVFPPQHWQAGAPFGPGRMVPDVAASADPDHGHQICLNGEWQVTGGTSAVAPLYAGLFAACGKRLAPIGPKLWLNHVVFNDISNGDNGAFRARIGPDACTGLGSPIAYRLAKLLGGVP